MELVTRPTERQYRRLSSEKRCEKIDKNFAPSDHQKVFHSDVIGDDDDYSWMKIY